MVIIVTRKIHLEDNGRVMMGWSWHFEIIIGVSGTIKFEGIMKMMNLTSVKITNTKVVDLETLIQRWIYS